MMMKKFPVKHLPLDFIGLFFSMTGFIMVLLCLVGCIYDSGRGLYFLKVADSQPTANASMTAYYGWQAYCIDDINLGLNCYTDRSVMVVPFGK
jgi:hypothetical protein